MANPILDEPLQNEQNTVFAQKLKGLKIRCLIYFGATVLVAAFVLFVLNIDFSSWSTILQRVLPPVLLPGLLPVLTVGVPRLFANFDAISSAIPES